MMAGFSRQYGRGGVVLLRGACGDMPSIGDPMTPDPRSRSAVGGLKVVPTVWVQRAVNAYEARAGRAARLTVDGVAGAQTRSALEQIRLRMLSTYHPIPADPAVTAMPTILDRGHMTLSTALHELLANNVRIADPAGSPVAECSWSEPVGPNRNADGATVIGPDLDPPSSGPTGYEWVKYVALAAGTAVGLGVVVVGVAAGSSR